MSDVPSSWILEPTFRCVSLIGEEVKVTSVLCHAVFAFSRLEPVLLAARQQLRGAGKSDLSITKLIEASRTLGKWAQELVDDDYQAVVAHSLVGLWTTVEVAVEDTATLVLVNDPRAVGDLASAGVGLPRTLSKPLNETDSRRAYGALERHSRVNRSVAECYCYLLGLLGVTVSVTSDVTVTLAELNYVRNCLLHRGGVVDERSTKEAPRLAIPVGGKIRIDEAASQKYLKAVGDFAQALLNGVINSPHNPIRGDSRVAGVTENARQKLIEVDAKIAALKADNRRIEEERDQEIARVKAATQAEIDLIRAVAAGEVVEVRDDAFTVITPGEWYIVVDCDRCRRPIPVLRDRTNGGVRFAALGAFRVTCPQCGVRTDYPAALAESRHVLEDGSFRSSH